MNNVGREKFANFGMISPRTVSRIRDEVREISDSAKQDLLRHDDFSLRMRQSEMFHLKKEGMSEEEALDYIEKIPQIVDSFDTVTYTQKKHDGMMIRGLLFQKVFPDGNMRSYFMISN